MVVVQSDCKQTLAASFVITAASFSVESLGVKDVSLELKACADQSITGLQYSNADQQTISSVCIVSEW